MLSRVASNIYWMGRYLERSEYQARYTKVQYFSMYDAPHLQSKDFVLSSIVNMTGIDYDLADGPLNEQEIILKVGLDRESNASIFSSVFNARENARSARNILSDELWEMINQYYLFIQKFDPEYFKTRGLYEFTLEINKHCNIIKSCLNQTLLHEFSWLLISLGIYLERCIQIIRTIKSKLVDISILTKYNKHPSLETYQWTTALKIVEAFDIYRRYIMRLTHPMSSQEFMIFHKTFPRSVIYCLKKVDEFANHIQAMEPHHKSLTFSSGKVYNHLKFQQMSEIPDILKFMDDLESKVDEVHTCVEENIFGHKLVNEKIPSKSSDSDQ